MAPEGGTYVPSLAVVAVASMTEVLGVLKTGEGNRSVGCTNMNEHSSRSHMILTVHVKSRNSATGARGFGKMHLIDLAGSERVGKSGAEGARLKEAQNINKSLSALGDCVQSLVSKSKHTPFRNSKLTHLLQDSLGGDSKALMFVCVSPSDTDVSETGCSLAFASRVRNVELGPAKRKGGSDPLTELKLKDKDREIEGLREMMRKVEGDKEKAEAKAKQLAKQKDEAEASKLSMSQEMDQSIGERQAEMMSEINALRSQLQDANRRLEEAPSSQWAHKRSAPPPKTSAPKTPRRGDGPAPKTPRQTPGKKEIEAKRTPSASRTEAGKTPSKAGAAATPRRGALRPATALGNISVGEGSSSTNSSTNKSLNRSDVGLSLDERLARLRTKKREAAELAQESANTSMAPPAKRPHSAMPARVGGSGSRLGSGAARVVRGNAQPSRQAANASFDQGGKKARTGGWR
uniref:Kinesin-like protein n=1 Tax=Hemiselmis andersenii TaxID=464988 RepID=A0A7S1EBH7_HEMAN